MAPRCVWINADDAAMMTMNESNNEASGRLQPHAMNVLRQPSNIGQYIDACMKPHGTGRVINWSIDRLVNMEAPIKNKAGPQSKTRSAAGSET
eukprot:scaffold681307_cov116-Prasinocladus_malaysianus.AAC.1